MIAQRMAAGEFCDAQKQGPFFFDPRLHSS